MKPTWMLRMVPVVSVALALLGGCGKKGDDKKDSGGKNRGEEGPKATLQMGVLALANQASLELNLVSAPPVLSDFVASSITSGAPESLTVKIAKMELISASGKSQTIFDEPTGKEVRIDGAYVDLSSLFTTFACVDKNGIAVDTGGAACPCGLDATNQPIPQVDGICPTPADPSAIAPAVGTLEVPVDTYSSLKVSFLRGARVKGCVSGTFGNGGEVTAGAHTYCTRADYSTFNATVGGVNANFENQEAQEMDFDLQLSNSFTQNKSGLITLDFPVSDNIVVSSSEAQRLTMVIDTNRLLRFYNQGRDDYQPPNPGLPGNQSYFFTTVFEGSTFVFTGVPGEIRGYSFVTNACAGETAPFPTDHVCTNNPFVVAGWLTMVFDKNGSPLLANIMPDDDNTLTVLKGGNKSSGGLQSSYFESAGTALWNVSGGLGSEEKNQTIFGVPTELAVGSETTNVYFEGMQSSYGTIRLKRGL
jgi:hypothetical protein